MSIGEDDTELALVLPYRGDLPLVDFLQLAFLSGYQEVTISSPTDLGASEGQIAIFYTPESGDKGTLCHFLRFEGQEMVLEPTSPSLGEEVVLRKPLVFLLARPDILGFFADWKHSAQGLHYFALPTRVLSRKARAQMRVQIEGNILIRSKSGRTFYGKLTDFTPSGASFFLDDGFLQPSEVVLVEFEIHGCGTCETVATMARHERITHPLYPHLYGIHFELKKAQKSKVEHLYLCKKAEQIKEKIRSFRDRYAGTLE